MEHVIPLSLGGMVELPNASCRNCEKITNSFEWPLGRETFVEVRAMGGIKSRRPKERPKKVPVKILFESGASKTVQVELQDAPIVFVTPFYERLPDKVNFPEQLASALRFEACFHSDFRRNKLALINKHGASKTQHYSRSIQPKNFARLIWKIALGSLWSVARKSVLNSNIRERVLTENAQYLKQSAPVIELRSQAKFQFADLFSEHRPSYPEYAQVSVETNPQELHRYIYLDICFDRRLGLPAYIARIKNNEGVPINRTVLGPSIASDRA
jgi:hypothetical protein